MIGEARLFIVVCSIDRLRLVKRVIYSIMACFTKMTSDFL